MNKKQRIRARQQFVAQRDAAQRDLIEYMEPAPPTEFFKIVVNDEIFTQLYSYLGRGGVDLNQEYFVFKIGGKLIALFPLKSQLRPSLIGANTMEQLEL